MIHDLPRDLGGGDALLVGHVLEVGGGAVGDDEAGQDAHHAHPVLADLGGQFAVLAPSLGLLREAVSTIAPAAANRRTVASPRPRLPPVTSTRRPSSPSPAIVMGISSLR
ncbi:hypothetical protein GCM10023191_088990 [Actinoallomurus oryzae]|uniref:Uncharacterized protein n=1 Tax=Actinoallomurus oryzae TaxID=502180 RepID=A0ABP8R487_9ACTN